MGAGLEVIVIFVFLTGHRMMNNLDQRKVERTISKLIFLNEYRAEFYRRVYQKVSVSGLRVVCNKNYTASITNITRLYVELGRLGLEATGERLTFEMLKMGFDLKASLGLFFRSLLVSMCESVERQALNHYSAVVHSKVISDPKLFSLVEEQCMAIASVHAALDEINPSHSIKTAVNHSC